MQRTILLSLVLVFILLGAMPAVAAEPKDAAEQIAFRGYYIETGAPADFEAVEDLIDDTDATTRAVYFVSLRTNPSGGADLFADETMKEVGGGTVIVVTPAELGAASSEFDDDAIDTALDSAPGGATDEQIFRAFADNLPDSSTVVTSETPASATEGPTTAEPAATSTSGGGSGGLIFLVFIVGIVGLIGFAIWRNSKKEKDVVEGRMDEAQDELKGQMDVIANEILDLSDRVTVSENEQAIGLYRGANDTYAAVSDAAASATNLAELERLSDQLDEARWQLEAAEALIEGREAPPKPENRPSHCFFDPSHRAGIEEAEIRTPAGSREVSVCRDCAAKMRRGETPTPRSINVGGRPVPAPQAPRSYGGGGMDWLGAFSILLGGLGRGVSYDLGQPRRVRSSSSSSGGLGGGLSRIGKPGSTRRSRSRSTPASSRSTPRPSSRTSSAPKTKGRGRRRRKR